MNVQPVCVDSSALWKPGAVTVAGPASLRTLDAIHLGTALSIGDHPEAFITCDDRLARAAEAAGLEVVQPGR